jgi:hypothetical protein
MLPSDPTGKQGCPIPLPDKFTIREPKEEKEEDLFPKPETQN